MSPSLFNTHWRRLEPCGSFFFNEAISLSTESGVCVNRPVTYICVRAACNSSTVFAIWSNEGSEAKVMLSHFLSADSPGVS